jgi:hypothetical protein
VNLRLKTAASFCKDVLRKLQFFLRKFQNEQKNCDHNIDPLESIVLNSFGKEFEFFKVFLELNFGRIFFPPNARRPSFGDSLVVRDGHHPILLHMSSGSGNRSKKTPAFCLDVVPNDIVATSEYR